MDNMNTMIVIPAFNPSEALIPYVKDLKSKGLNNIIIVNDGSDKKHDYIFDTLKENEGIIYLSNYINMGKGYSLKKAFSYFLKISDISEFNGIITVDADGQHSVKDVIVMAKTLNEKNNSLILGCRDFNDRIVPLKSEFGNKMTRFILRLLYSRKLSDTQTGLRAIPVNLLEEMTKISGNRFEYETKMLTYCFTNNIDIEEIVIDTIYYENNATSSFKAISDSYKIYRSIFAPFIIYIFIAFSSFIADISLFSIFLFILSYYISSRKVIIFATIFARIISSFVNFLLNKKFVFNYKKNFKNAFYKYYTLCIGQMITSALCVLLIWEITKYSEVSIKIFVDIILFFISFKIQQNWVFKNKNIN